MNESILCPVDTGLNSRGPRWKSVLSAVVVGISTFTTTVAVAGQAPGENFEQYVERQRQDRTWLFLGLGGGLANLASVPLPEKTKTGFQFHLYGGLSFYKPSWIFDVGGGWFYNKVSSDDTLGTITRVITRGGFVEGSARYRLTNEWSLGPVVQGIFSSDTTFSESELDKSGANIMAGGRLIYEWPIDNLVLMRLGGQAMTDLTIQNRQMWTFQVLAQIGFPLGSESKKHAAPAPQPVAPAPRPAPVVAKGPAKIVDEKTIAVSLDERLILFPTNKAVIRSPYKERVQQFAMALKSDLSGWGHLRVEGHSDVRGKRARNIQLSFERASAVGQFLIQEGVPNGRVEAKGMGPDFPLDPANSQIAWAKNRRVELVITDVKNVNKLADEINMIWPEDAPVPLLVDKPKPKPAAMPKHRPKKKKSASST